MNELDAWKIRFARRFLSFSESPRNVENVIVFIVRSAVFLPLGFCNKLIIDRLQRIALAIEPVLHRAWNSIQKMTRRENVRKILRVVSLFGFQLKRHFYVCVDLELPLDQAQMTMTQ